MEEENINMKKEKISIKKMKNRKLKTFICRDKLNNKLLLMLLKSLWEKWLYRELLKIQL